MFDLFATPIIQIFLFPHMFLSIVPSAEKGGYLEDGKENVDDVHVELDCAVDVLLGADLDFSAAHDLLGVVHQVLKRKLFGEEFTQFSTI